MIGVIPAEVARAEDPRSKESTVSGDLATHELREEHELILEVLDLMAELASEDAGGFDASRLATHQPAFSEFLESFADRFHHAKEEALLFAHARPFLVHCNPIEQMLYEHALMRELRVAMDEAHRARDLAALTEACAELCQTLAQHIFKENHVLYPMVEQVLSDEARAALGEGYDEVRKRSGGPALRERFEAMRDALRDELG